MPMTELATSAALSTNNSLHSRTSCVIVLALSLGRLCSLPYTSSVRLTEADSSTAARYNVNRAGVKMCPCLRRRWPPCHYVTPK